MTTFFDIPDDVEREHANLLRGSKHSDREDSLSILQASVTHSREAQEIWRCLVATESAIGGSTNLSELGMVKLRDSVKSISDRVAGVSSGSEFQDVVSWLLEGYEKLRTASQGSTSADSSSGTKWLNQPLKYQVDLAQRDVERGYVNRCLKDSTYDESHMRAHFLREALSVSDRKGGQSSAFSLDLEKQRIGKIFSRKKQGALNARNSNGDNSRRSKARQLSYAVEEKLKNFCEPRPLAAHEGVPISDPGQIDLYVRSLFQQ